MLLYADEDFSFPVVEELRRLGHDVVTAQEDGMDCGSRSRHSGPRSQLLAGPC